MDPLTRRILCFGVLPLGAYAQLAPGPDVTAGFTNGRLWLKLDDSTKHAFLVGCRDGFLMGAIQVAGADYAKIPEALKFPELTTNEIAKEMDLFYSEGSNGPIPILIALRYIRRKVEGDTTAQLQEILSTWRRHEAAK